MAHRADCPWKNGFSMSVTAINPNGADEHLSINEERIYYDPEWGRNYDGPGSQPSRKESESILFDFCPRCGMSLKLDDGLKELRVVVSDEELKKMKDELEKCQPDFKILNPEKVLEKLLQQEADTAAVYGMNRIDNGGNSLIGDVLDEDECEGIIENNEG